MNRISGTSSPSAPLPSTARQGVDAPRGMGRRDRAEVDPQIRAAAEGMESMFVNQMLQAMRKTVEKSEMSLDSPATEIYQSMLDSEMAQKTARLNSIGLADQIIAYLESGRYNVRQGASNEGKPAIRGGAASADSTPVQEVPSHARE